MAKRKYSYRISLTQFLTPVGDVAVGNSIAFEHFNHDDLHLIVERVRAASGLPSEDATAMVMGFKLLNAV